MPFDRLVEVLKPERNLSHNPLFQVKFTLQNTATREPAAQTLSRLAASSIITEHNTAKFDVLISMIERGNRFSGWLEYNTDIFAERRMQRLIQHFIYVLERMVAQPACQLVVSKEMLVALDKEEAQQRALELQHVGLSKLSKIRRRTNQAERQ
jgi:non-ribosomal peptide synthetase component F